MEAAGVSSLGSLFVSGTSLLTGAVTGNSSASFGGNINSNTSISITDAAGILNFKNGSAEKGFVQLSGDDLRVGTFSSNVDGRLVIRTGGSDNVFVDNIGNVGVGTGTPDNKLHVNGSLKVNTGRIVDEDNRSLVPIAWGFFNQTGTKLRGSQNISVVVTDIIGGVYQKYWIQVLGYTDLSDACIVVTPRSANERLSSTKWENNQLKVWFSADNFYSQGLPCAFSVIVYR